MKRVWALSVVASIVIGAAACSSNTPASESAPAASGTTPPSAVAAADKEWTSQNKNPASTRYSTVSEINTGNVKNLKVAWTFSTGVLRGHEGGPLVVGNTMYVHTPFPNIVYALDLTKEGAPVKWKYAPKQDPNVIPIACCDTVSRGLAYADGKIFQNQLDTTTVALDAATGQGAVEGQAGRLQDGADGDVSADGREGQSDLRNLRRRVRRARVCHGERHQHRQAGVADVQHRT
jgi:glucose dehydrogenase